MSLGPLTTPKPRMTLEAFKTMQKDTTAASRGMFDAFANAAARLGYASSNLSEGTSYPFNRITLNYVLLTSLYRGNWIVRKVVDTVVDDMTKNWLTPISEMAPKKLKRLQVEGFDKLGLTASINRAEKWARLYGGAAGIMLIKGRDDFDQPLLPEDVEIGSFRGLLVRDRWSGISPSATIGLDLDKPENFGLPEHYQVTTETKTFKVHHTRVLRFNGPELPEWEWQANSRWGASVVEAMFEELKKRDNTSFNIASLVFRANIMELNSPTLEQTLSGLGSGQNAQQRFYNSITAITQLMSNQGLIVTGDKQTMSQHSYGFAGISDVYMQFMMDVCGATEYPMSRLFGRSSSGLAGTSEGDEHAYFELVRQRQVTKFDPVMRQLLPVLCASIYGKMPDDLEWNWNPVNSMSDKERVELATSATTAFVETYNAGLISQKKALEEMKEQSAVTGIWTNITVDDIEAADDEVMAPMEMGAPGEEDGFVGEPRTAKGNKGTPKKDAKDAMDAGTNKSGNWRGRSGFSVKQQPARMTEAEEKEKQQYQAEANRTGKVVKGKGNFSEWEFTPQTNDAALEHSTTFQGLTIDIEQLRGSTRHGKNFHQRMTAPYGYIRNTEGTDGDEVDCFIGPIESAPYVYVIHTRNRETGDYDEDKVILGVESAAKALELFEENYNAPGFFDSMDKMTVAEFKDKLKTLKGKKLVA